MHAVHLSALDIQKLEKAHRVAINVDPKGHILIKGPDDKVRFTDLVVNMF